MKRIAIVAIAFSFASLTFLAAEPASAAPNAAAMEEGRIRFQKGVSLFRAGDFRAALVEFNAANAVAPSFRIQFNIGQTCAELKENVCATKAFEKFLADGGKQVPPQQRGIAEKELERLHALVGRVHVVVDTKDAEVSIDDVPAGTSPIDEPVLVDAGARKVSAKKGASPPVSSLVEVKPGETVEVSLALGDHAPANDANATVSPEVGRTPFWIGLAATGVLTAATVTLGVLSLGAKSDLDDTAGRFGVTNGELDDARSKVDNLTLATDLVGLCAIAAAGITAYFFITTKPASTRVGVGPGSIRLLHSF